jgi:uncharacterized protein (TIGR02246 family)
MTAVTRSILIGGALGVAACARIIPTPASEIPPVNAVTVRSEVAANLASDARAWNSGDLDAFLSAYLPGDSTTFVTNRGVLHGMTSIRAAYVERFKAGTRRDSLRFDNLEVDVLAPGVINAIARYVLARGDSVVSSGPTSLVMRWNNGRWRIVHDHSS